MEPIVIKWVEFVDVNVVPDRSIAGQGTGIYLYTIPDLGYSPFYVGTAGESRNSSLRTRVKSSQNGFSQNLRTFVRLEVIENNKGSSLTAIWNKPQALFVPGSQRYSPKVGEGAEFFKRLKKFYAEIAVPQEENPRAYLRAVEAVIQQGIREVYLKENPDLRLAITAHSRLLGQTNVNDLKRGRSLIVDYSEDSQCEWFKRHFAIRK